MSRTNLLRFLGVVLFSKPAKCFFSCPPQARDARSVSLATSLATYQETTNVLSADQFPYRVCVVASDKDNTWIEKAVDYLHKNGVCVIYSDKGSSLIENCHEAEDGAQSRLSFLKERIRGVDADQGVFRFMEVVSRDVAGGRFDMPVPWKTQSQSQHGFGIPLKKAESDAFFQFHKSLEDTIQPIIDQLWKDDLDSHVAASGFLINQPGSTDQSWHRDGPQAGLINVFVPLVDLTLEIGPTEVWSNTHEAGCDDESQKIVPLMKTGQILMMDYRTFHRGLGNYCSKGISRTVAYAVWHKGASSLADKLSCGLLPRAYPSIAGVSDASREGEDKPFRVRVSPNDPSWILEAKQLMRETGVCLLEDNKHNFPNELVKKAIQDRFEDVQQRIENRGVDRDEPFQFLELSCKDGGRFHVPVGWKNQQQDTGLPLPAPASKCITQFHCWMEALVEPVLRELWEMEEDNFHVANSEFVINQPGSQQYQWSRECEDEGYIQAFSPLTDLTSKDVGPIEVWPKSHTRGDHGNSNQMLPLPMLGQILLIDRRILYQYLPNTLQEWTMASVLWQKGRSTGARRNMPNALTLEYD